MPQEQGHVPRGQASVPKSTACRKSRAAKFRRAGEEGRGRRGGTSIQNREKRNLEGGQLGRRGGRQAQPLSVAKPARQERVGG